MTTLLLFIALQFCDVLTTVVFLQHGVNEGNPLVRMALALSNNPALPLFALKVVACVLAYLGWRSGRRRLLNHVNVFFGLCVIWNLVAIVFSRHA